MDVKSVMSRASDGITVGRAFGPAYEHGETIVIPVAFVAGGGGGAEATPTAPDSGSGFGGVSWPIGVYVVRGDRVEWIPARDQTLVVLAMIGAVKTAMRLLARRAAARAR
jgi:uncharacterized spore protein YtfJ